MRYRVFTRSLIVVLALACWYQGTMVEAADKKKNRFEQKLKIVVEHEKNIPKDTIGAQKTTASVKPHKGVPALWIDDKPVFPMAMIAIGHHPKNVCRDFSAAGVHIYSHIIWTWNSLTVPALSGGIDKSVHWWLGPGKYDFGKIDRQILSIIEADPQAYIFLRLKLNPPKWWLKAYPDEIVQYEDGRHGPQVSLASERWEQTYERMLRDLIRHIEGSEYAGHIIGYQPAGGRCSEWYWWGSNTKGLVDYSPAARNRFRKWLNERYHANVQALRKSWNDSDVTFETARLPGRKAREQSEYMLFRDVRKAGRVIDFHRFLCDVTAHNIVRSCRICKEETGGKKITGVFYGYSMHYACKGELWNAGLLGLKQVLDSPHVDFLCAPTDYRKRRGGDPGVFVSEYIASYMLHGKLYWDEADVRTHLFSGRASYATRSLSETLSVFERGFGYMLTKGTALWWFTLAGDDTFHQNEMMEGIAGMQKIGEASMPVDKKHIHDVAVLVDEETFFYMRKARRGIDELAPLMRNMRVQKLPKMGAPFDLYLLSDIANKKMPDYKLYIFLNSFYVSDTIREAIKKKVRRNGAVSAWFYAPGFIKEDGTFSEEAMRDLTGIRIRHEAKSRELQLNITNFDHPVTSKAKQSSVTKPTKKLGPTFWADDPKAVTLGHLSPDGKAGMVVRDFGSWRSVYCAALEIPTSVLRGLIRYAGGHVYSTSDDTFYANNNYIMIHTATSGQKHIALPEPRDVYDVLQAKLIGRNLTSINVDLPDGVTRIYQLHQNTKDHVVSP